MPTMVHPNSLANLTSPGKPKGTINKQTAELRAAILEAAESGQPDGIVGYYRNLKAMLPEKFADAMLRLLPKDITVSGSVTMTHAAVAEMSSAFPAELVALASLDWKALPEGVRTRLMVGLRALAQDVEAGVGVIDTHDARASESDGG